jgi:hypothetical protein
VSKTSENIKTGLTQILANGGSRATGTKRRSTWSSCVLFDPVATFGDDKDQRFVFLEHELKAKLTTLFESEEAELNTFMLLTVASEAYDYVGSGVSQQKFDSALIQYHRDVLSMAIMIESQFDAKQLSWAELGFGSAPVSTGRELTEMMVDATVLLNAWELLNSLVRTSFTSDRVAQLMGMAALLEIDSMLASIATHRTFHAHHDLVYATEMVVTARHLIGEAALTRRAMRTRAMSAARKRWQLDTSQLDRQMAHVYWMRWLENPSLYSSKAEFARDIVEKAKSVVNHRVVENWCRAWERER